MTTLSTYRHSQRGPWSLLLCFFGVAALFAAWTSRNEAPQPFLTIALGSGSVLMLILAAAFIDLTVEDEGDRLAVRFGPVPIFQKRVRYADIQSVEVGTTTLLDGWGIHLSAQGGWVWNIWGRDCVVVHLSPRGTLRIGTDDAENLARFIQSRLPPTPEG